jgi:choline dehydrogenase
METFDYIIVGAGTAGCVVARRLADRGRDRILLLEAGGSDRRFWIQVPIGYGRTFNDPRVNWMYETEPDTALMGRRGFCPRGKVLGGSGSINAMVYARGLARDFDGWAALGNAGWSYRDVLPYFRRAEDYDGPDSEYHARTGPMHVTEISAQAHPLCRFFVDTCVALGYPRSSDFNGAQAEGVGVYDITTRGGMRESTARSYLRPALGNSQLSLRLNSQVTRIRFDGRRAIGVSYRNGNSGHEADARKAIILCGGAINTPQLLQLSGVGPAELLRRYAIEIVADHPAVGRHLQDHVGISNYYRSKVPTLNGQLYPWWGKLWAGLTYVLTRRGPLSLSVNQGGGFVRSDPTLKDPNLQLYFNPLSYTTAVGPNRRLMNPDPFPAFLLGFNPCRPTSEGYVEIKSPDPYAAPSIQTNYMSTEHDVADIVAGVRLMRRIAASAPLSGIIASEIQPGESLRSEAELLADFRERATSVFHMTCSCRMGSDATNSVVDPQLRVHGLTGLRIVDASVFPTVTSGNTNAPTVMVAEKGAALIAADE